MKNREESAVKIRRSSHCRNEDFLFRVGILSGFQKKFIKEHAECEKQ